MSALNAARSAVSTAISRILQEPTFGDRGQRADQIRIQGAESFGLVIFDRQEAGLAEVPSSTNNLRGTEDVQGSEGVLVPAATVHLYGVGRCGSVERRVEAVLHLPPFPWAIASGGQVQTRNGVLVGALPPGVWPPPSDESQLLPADVLANGEQQDAIVLASGTSVLGDVETPGQVVTMRGARVKGEIRPGSTPAQLPTLQPERYDPEAVDGQFFTVTGQEESLTGSARGKGEVVFPRPLTLNSANLYVEGSLSLPRGVRGGGTLVVTGDISIGGAADVQSLGELAVVSGGKVRLTGQGPERASLRGLFYAEEGLEAAEITLVGSLLTGRASTGISLDHVNVLYEPMQAATQQVTISNGGVDFRPPWWADDWNWLGVHEETDPVVVTALDTDPVKPDGWLYVDLAPTNGGYPVTVTFHPTGWLLNFPPQTLNGPEDISAVVQELRTATDETLSSPGFSDNYLWSRLFAKVEQQLKLSLQGGTGNQQQSTIRSEISLFLPLEDRIRVVSWLER